MKNIFLALLFTAITGLSHGQAIQWTFNTGPDGWVLTNSLTGTVGSGIYNITITGSDPYMLSPNNLNIDATTMGQIKIRLQNNTADSPFQLFWITNTDNTWNQSKSVLFPVNTNDITQTDYTLNLLGNTQWSGTIKQLRLDPGNNNTSGNVKIDEIDVLPLEFGLDNGTVHVRLDLSRGGAISYISKSSGNRNLVNIHDEGRYVQQSYYAGNAINRQAEGQSPSWSPWSWNPIQVGDSHSNRAQILNNQMNVDTLYVKCTPMLWDMNNMPAEAEMEQWTSLDSNAIKVKCRLTCHRTDTIYGEGIWNNQELPAVYPISALKNLYTYFGTVPFTNAPLSNPPVVNLSSGFWGVYMNDTVTENWMAFVNDSLWGMGVYKPLNANFLAGMAGTPGSEATDPSTCYIAPVKLEELMKNSVYEYTYYLVIGTLSEIREKIYDIKADTLTTSAAQLEKDKQEIFIHPNPFSETADLRITNPDQLRIAGVKMFDIVGKEVHPTIIRNSDSFVISRGNLSDGIYFIRITDGEKVINRKLVVE